MALRVGPKPQKCNVISRGIVYMLVTLHTGYTEEECFSHGGKVQEVRGL